LVFVNNIDALGLKAAQGLYLTTAWYWDLNSDTRAFGKRFFDRMKRQPSMTQSGSYSATMTYLKAVTAAGTTDADKVMAELKKAKINDMFAKDAYIRADGLMVHDMYVVQVKSPQESKYPWDYYKVVKVMSGEEAFGPITGSCPLAAK
jgi:branched-chain amino acid transport system substrate-binding protein